MEFTEKVKQRNADRPASGLCDLELLMGTKEQHAVFHQKIVKLQHNFPRIKYDSAGNASGAGGVDVDALAAGEYFPGVGFMMIWAKKHYPEFMGSGSPVSVAVQKGLNNLSAAAIQRDLKRLSGDEGLKDMDKLAKTLKTKQGERMMENSKINGGDNVKTFQTVVQAYIGLGNTRGGAVKQAVRNYGDLHARYLEDLQRTTQERKETPQTFEEMVRSIRKDRGLSSRAEAIKALHDESLKKLNGPQ